MQNSTILTNGNCSECIPQGARYMKSCRGCFNVTSPCNQEKQWTRDEPTCQAANCSGGCMVDGAKCSPFSKARGCATHTCNKMLNEQSCLSPDYGGTYCHTCDAATYASCLGKAYCFYTSGRDKGCCTGENNTDPVYPYNYRTTGTCAGCATATSCEACWAQWPCSSPDKNNIMPWADSNGFNHLNLSLVPATDTTGSLKAAVNVAVFTRLNQMAVGFALACMGKSLL